MDLISTHICMTKDLGVHNNLFGGIMMSHIDEAAASYACMYCDTPRMVTVRVNELIFKKPVKVGDLVKFYCKVKDVGNSSITIYVEAKKHNPTDGEEIVVTSTDITFVRIDENGHSTPIDESIKNKFKTTNILKK